MGVSTFKRSSIVLGKDGAGKDFKAFGDTSGAYLLWDASANKLKFIGGADMDFGSFGTPLVVNQTNNYPLGIFGEISVAQTTGSTVQRTIWARLAVSASQTSPASEFGGQLQLRWKDGATTLGSGTENAQYGGAWLYLEQDTTGQALADYAHASGAVVQVETWGSLTIPTNAHLSGLKIESRLGAANSAAISNNSGTIAGLFITKSPAASGVTAAAWPFGIFIEDCVVAIRIATTEKIEFRSTSHYIQSDAANDLLINAGTNLMLGIGGTDVVSVAAALVTLAQITSITDSTEASAVGTASLKTAGGLGVAGKAYIGTELFLVAGPLDMSTVAEDIEIKADTDSALEIKGTATLLDFDTRVTITGITAFGFTVPAATIATAAGITRVGVSITPGTTTLSNSVGVTAMEGLGLYISAPTLTSTGNPAVALASTLYIANAPQAGGTATITAGYALKIAAGNFLTAGRIIVDDATASTDTITGSIQTDGGLGVAGRGNFGGKVIITGGAQTAAMNNLYSVVNSSGSAGWTGSVAATRSRVLITNTGANIGNAYGGWFAVQFSTGMTAIGAGLTCGVYAEAASEIAATNPSAVAVFQSVSSSNGNQSGMPILVLTSIGGSGDKPMYAIEFGLAAAATTVGAGSGEMFYQQTIKCKINGTDYFMPFSTVEGTYTTAYAIVTSYNGSPSVSIGTNALPLTTATTGRSALKIWSDTTIDDGEYHVPLWVTSILKKTGGGSIYGIRGHTEVGATFTMDSVGYIIGVQGRVRCMGTMNAATPIMAGVHGQILDGGTWTAVSHVCAIWADNQLNTAITAGQHELIYMTNNNAGAQQLDQAFYIYGPWIANLFHFATSGQFILASDSSHDHFTGTIKKIKVLIDDVQYYMLASTTLGAS